MKETLQKIKTGKIEGLKRTYAEKPFGQYAYAIFKKDNIRFICNIVYDRVTIEVDTEKGIARKTIRMDLTNLVIGLEREDKYQEAKASLSNPYL